MRNVGIAFEEEGKKRGKKHDGDVGVEVHTFYSSVCDDNDQTETRTLIQELWENNSSHLSRSVLMTRAVKPAGTGRWQSCSE